MKRREGGKGRREKESFACGLLCTHLLCYRSIKVLALDLHACWQVRDEIAPALRQLEPNDVTRAEEPAAPLIELRLEGAHELVVGRDLPYNSALELWRHELVEMRMRARSMYMHALMEELP